MDKFKKQIKENKQMVISVLVAILISGLLGFYGGRFYERNTFRQSFANRRGTMMQNRTGINGNFNRGNALPTPQNNNSPQTTIQQNQ